MPGRDRAARRRHEVRRRGRCADRWIEAHTLARRGVVEPPRMGRSPSGPGGAGPHRCRCPAPRCSGCRRGCQSLDCASSRTGDRRARRSAVLAEATRRRDDRLSDSRARNCVSRAVFVDRESRERPRSTARARPTLAEIKGETVGPHRATRARSLAGRRARSRSPGQPTYVPRARAARRRECRPRISSTTKGSHARATCLS